MISHKARMILTFTGKLFQIKCNFLSINLFSERKYSNLRKNVLLHLTYAFLLLQDYTNVIKTGNTLLRRS